MRGDEFYMRRCLELAAHGKGQTSPNPLVGCVIVHNHKIIAEAFHRVYGGPHAEVNAIAQVQNEELLATSTVYVNLEPCAHFGKTPPCANLLVSKGVQRVVIAQKDPNPQVAGKGIEILKSAGIQVDIGVCENEARYLNKRFNLWFEQKRPYFVLKYAQSEDGFMDIDRSNGQKGSYPISSPETRKLVHFWRSMENGILIGANTANTDDPTLNVREVAGKSPIRIVMNLGETLNPNLKLFTDGAPTLLFSSIPGPEGIDHIEISAENSFDVLTTELFNRGIQSVLVEGGKSIHDAFLQKGLWDEIRVIKSKKKLGQGLKAPQLEMSPDHVFQHGKDQIRIYRKE